MSPITPSSGNCIIRVWRFILYVSRRKCFNQIDHIGRLWLWNVKSTLIGLGYSQWGTVIKQHSESRVWLDIIIWPKYDSWNPCIAIGQDQSMVREDHASLPGGCGFTVFKPTTSSQSHTNAIRQSASHSHFWWGGGGLCFSSTSSGNNLTWNELLFWTDVRSRRRSGDSSRLHFL